MFQVAEALSLRGEVSSTSNSATRNRGTVGTRALINGLHERAGWELPMEHTPAFGSWDGSPGQEQPLARIIPLKEYSVYGIIKYEVGRRIHG